MPYIAGLSGIHLQYVVDMSAQPSSRDPGHCDLTEQLARMAQSMCMLAYKFKPNSLAGTGSEVLFPCPGLTDAALTQLAGLAQYLHKQHAAWQSRRSAAWASADQGDGVRSRSSSSSGGGGRGESKASSGNNASSSSSKAARVVVASMSFPLLLLPPYHEAITVAGGKKAIAAHAAWLEQQCGAVLLENSNPSSDDACCMLLGMYHTSCGILIHALSSHADNRTTGAAPGQSATQSTSSAGAASAGAAPAAGTAALSAGATAQAAGGAGKGADTLLVAGVAQNGGGVTGSGRDGDLSALGTISIMQLLLELAGWLCSNRKMGDSWFLAVANVVDAAATCLAPEQLVSFYTTDGEQLLQLLWLLAEWEPTTQEGVSSWHSLLQGVFLSIGGE